MILNYHGSPLNKDRLKKNICRCQSHGKVFDIGACIKNGKVQDPYDEKRTLTSPPLDYSSNAAVFIFAIDKKFKMRFAADGDRDHDLNAVKHETLFHNADLLAAGELQFEDGVLSDINDGSGSYGARGKMEVYSTIATSILRAVNRDKIPITAELTRRLEALGAEE